MKTWIVMWALLVSVQVWAAVEGDVVIRTSTPAPRGDYHNGIGSAVSFQLPKDVEAREGIFLGKTIHPDGHATGAMVLDTKNDAIYYVPQDHLNLTLSDPEKLLDLYDQMGGTCTGYAIDDYLQQLHLTGFRGSRELEKDLSTEQGRTSLLVDSVSEYYLVTQHRNSIAGVLNKYGKKYGFECKKTQKDTAEKAREFIIRNVASGQPMLLSFNLGPDMETSKYKLHDLGGKHKRLDRRLWIPRQKGQRNAGGHTIVGVATFEHKGKTQLLVLDSDWDEPRVWNLDDYVNDRTAVEEMEFITCSES